QVFQSACNLTKMKPKGRREESDPAWSRSLSKSKKQMSSRAATRRLWKLVMKKKAENCKSKGEPTCVTRTVELSGTENVGKESSKLLFILALGLTPKIDKISNTCPVVQIEKLDPNVEAEAKSRTRDVIFRIFRQRKVEQLLDRIDKPPPAVTVTQAVQDQPKLSVEVVSLISSDDEASSEDEPAARMATAIRNDHVTRPRVNGSLSSVSNSRTYPMASTTSPVRKPVFKPHNQNNQDSGIFRNWKPESMTSLMNMNKKAGSPAPSNSNIVKESMFLTSLKSVPKNSTLTINNFTTKATSRKTQVNGVVTETSSSVAPDFVLPEKQPIITID
ncbi:hypothetical protein Ocin01_11422, partial [Orchesella cincta]